MTLVLKIDLDMVKMSYHTKNEVSMSRHSKVIACPDTHTDTHRHTQTQTHTHTQYENITFPFTWVVIKAFAINYGDRTQSYHTGLKIRGAKGFNPKGFALF